MAETHTILIVDDERNIREFLSVGLSMEGYKILTGENGADALDVVKAQKVDLVILDVNMPGMNGWETLEHLRKKPETEKIPVLMLTAEGTVKDVDKAMNLGATSYLVKPFDIERLLKKLAIMLKKPSS